MDVAWAAVAPSAKRRVPMGDGAWFGLRVGVELWEQLAIGFSAGSLFFQDSAPVSEQVVDCTEINGTVIFCDDEPRDQKSTINGGLLGYDLGYQFVYRFLPWLSVTPVALLGYQHSPRRLRRSVDCRGCSDGEAVQFDAGGAYIGGSLKIAAGRNSGVAVLVRSQKYFLSDLRHATTAAIAVQFQ